MKTETKQNLWQIVKFLLTLGVSAIINAIKRSREKKISFTPEQLERSKRLQKHLDKAASIDVEALFDPYFKCDTMEDAEQIQRSIDRVVKRK